MCQPFVAYYRVSTKRQGESGLGLAAQQKAVREYVDGLNWRLVAEHVEIESGRSDNRPELTKALQKCRLTGATLLIAKLDRLSRSATFLLSLREAGIEFLAVDMLHANRLTVGIMALVAEQEREAISKRTQAALEAAKQRGVRLGNPDGFSGKVYRAGGEAARSRANVHAAQLASTLKEMAAEGRSLREIARSLELDGVRTARGGKWTAAAVRNVLLRLKSIENSPL